MKKGTIITIVVVGIVVLMVARYGISANNNMVEKQEGVRTAWSQVENQYQRRADLIPNLVNTVKGYATHEEQTLTNVIEARAKATQVKVDPDQLTDEALQKYMASQNNLSQALGRLMVVAEQYPELKANENFQMLQTQLERRIASPLSVSVSMRQPRSTTSISASFHAIYLRVSLALSHKPTSNPSLGQRWHRLSLSNRRG